MFMYHTLLGISHLIAMKEPWFSINFSWSAQLSGQSIILLLGGLFLIYKSTNEKWCRRQRQEEKN
jgi:hypothetical protein